MTDGTLLDRVRRRLAATGTDPTPAAVATALRAEGGVAGEGDVLATLHRLEDEVLGAGPLAPLLRDPDVTDVLVNAPDEVWVDRGRGLERTGVRFADDAAVRSLVQRLLVPAGRRLDAARPWVDARLPDGTRLHAVLAPVATRGTSVSLRTLRRQSFTLDDLVALGTVPCALTPWLRALVTARVPLVISGGTGTGKTTLLACLLGLVPAGERVVVVEDAAELRPDRPHVVLLEARPPNVEGAGEVTLRDLVRQALRMRPDRLVVGEVRGAEVADMLAAFNTGHDGGLTTLHANGPADVPARLEALGLAAGIGRDALHAALAAAVGAVLHLRRPCGEPRRMAEVAVPVRSADGLVTMTTALRRAAGGLRPGPGLARLRDVLAARGVDPPEPP